MKTVLVTGGNKGIGLEICRQLSQTGYHVILSARSQERGEAAIAALARERLKVEFLLLDTADETSIATAAAELRSRHKALHALINNAAILPVWGGSILESTAAELRDCFVTNTLGPILLTQALLPLLQAGRPARVINVSSQLGSLQNMTDGWTGYGISKSALNAATRKLADALKPRGISVVAASPGWVRTDMGGEGAPLPVEKGAANIIRHLTETSGSVTGQFLSEEGQIPW